MSQSQPTTNIKNPKSPIARWLLRWSRVSGATHPKHPDGNTKTVKSSCQARPFHEQERGTKSPSTSLMRVSRTNRAYARVNLLFVNSQNALVCVKKCAYVCVCQQTRLCVCQEMSCISSPRSTNCFFKWVAKPWTQNPKHLQAYVDCNPEPITQTPVRHLPSLLLGLPRLPKAFLAKVVKKKKAAKFVGEERPKSFFFKFVFFFFSFFAFPLFLFSSCPLLLFSSSPFSSSPFPSLSLSLSFSFYGLFSYKDPTEKTKNMARLHA